MSESPPSPGFIQRFVDAIGSAAEAIFDHAETQPAPKPAPPSAPISPPAEPSLLPPKEDPELMSTEPLTVHDVPMTRRQLGWGLVLSACFMLPVILFLGAAALDEIYDTGSHYEQPPVQITGDDGILHGQTILSQHSSPSGRYALYRFKGHDPIGAQPATFGRLADSVTTMVRSAHRELRLPLKDAPELDSGSYKCATVHYDCATIIYDPNTEQGWIYVTHP
jgi:hypothetical protein